MDRASLTRKPVIESIMIDTPTCGDHAGLLSPVDQSQLPSSTLSHAAADGQATIATGPQQVHCWACHTMITVPHVGESGQPAPVFKASDMGRGRAIEA